MLRFWWSYVSAKVMFLLELAPNGSPYILEVGLFVESDRGDFFLNSFMDRLGSWRSVFLSNRIMEISCQIVSWIALCLGGWSFCWIESCRFPVGLLRWLHSVFWVGQVIDLFLLCCFNIPICFWGWCFLSGCGGISCRDLLSWGAVGWMFCVLATSALPFVLSVESLVESDQENRLSDHV